MCHYTTGCSSVSAVSVCCSSAGGWDVQTQKSTRLELGSDCLRIIVVAGDGTILYEAASAVILQVVAEWLVG
jgi:hypothetical protein